MDLIYGVSMLLTILANMLLAYASKLGSVTLEVC